MGARDTLASKAVWFASNASFGVGGQGEFLKQMALAIDGLPRGRVFCRDAPPGVAGSASLPFRGIFRKVADAVASVPGLNRRRDWQVLLSDIEFDDQVSKCSGEVDLFDGIMAQCCSTVRRLKDRSIPIVITSLNSHIDHLVDALEREHARIGFSGRTFIHPRMRARAIEEFRMADRIRVNSEFARRTFLERGFSEDRVFVIRPGIDHRHFRPIAKPDSVFRVLAVSSIEPRKGIHYLLEAFQAAKIPNSELVLIGGTGDPWSRKMLEGYQRTCPNLRRRAVDVLTAPLTESYGSASVLVHPAVEDGYALVVPQALACGRPVIATRETGASELIEDGKTGFVVDAASSQAIAERLSLLASDARLLDSMSAAAPAAVARLGYDDFQAQLFAFYASVIA